MHLKQKRCPHGSLHGWTIIVKHIGQSLSIWSWMGRWELYMELLQHSLLFSCMVVLDAFFYYFDLLSFCLLFVAATHLVTYLLLAFLFFLTVDFFFCSLCSTGSVLALAWLTNGLENTYKVKLQIAKWIRPSPTVFVDSDIRLTSGVYFGDILWHLSYNYIIIIKH